MVVSSPKMMISDSTTLTVRLNGSNIKASQAPTSFSSCDRQRQPAEAAGAPLRQLVRRVGLGEGGADRRQVARGRAAQTVDQPSQQQPVRGDALRRQPCDLEGLDATL